MIKNLSEFQNTLGGYGAKDWSKKVDVSDFPSGGGLDKVSSPDMGTKSFGEFLQDSLSKVNSMQNEANVAMEKLASGESKNLHETLLAVEQAEISFKMMNQIRTKVLDAYKEVMRMQI